MNDTSIRTARAALCLPGDSNLAVARRRLQRPPSKPEMPDPSASAQAAPEPTASIVRWIPLVLPLLAALMACDAYAIAWVVTGLYR